jgi:hypothetical protein
MPDDASQPAPQGQFLIYADGASQLRVRLDGNTIWLTQKLIAERYGVSVKTVNEPLVNIYSEAELPPEATIRNFRIVQREGTRNVEHYSLRRDSRRRLPRALGMRHRISSVGSDKLLRKLLAEAIRVRGVARLL